jgi:hypothetical protein
MISFGLTVVETFFLGATSARSPTDEVDGRGGGELPKLESSERSLSSMPSESNGDEEFPRGPFDGLSWGSAYVPCR